MVWDTTLQKIETLEKLEDSSPDLPARSLLPFLARFSGTVAQDELFRLASPLILKAHQKLCGGNGSAELPSWLSDALTVGLEEWDDHCYGHT